jgi:hypothetical protein
MKEFWKDIKKYEGHYQASNLGRIRSIKFKSRILKFHKSRYLFTHLSKNGKTEVLLVHRVIAQTWIKNPKNLLTVNHKDGNKLNNNIMNLEWCSPSYNIIHSFKMGLSHPQKSENNWSTKLTKEMVKEIRDIKGISQKYIAKLFGIDQSNVSYIINNKTWKNV